MTADNSLFTCYNFLADHHSEYQIILEEGKVMKGSRRNHESNVSSVSGEPILRKCNSGTTHVTHTIGTTTPSFDLDSEDSLGFTTTEGNQDLVINYGLLDIRKTRKTQMYAL